MLQHNGNTSPGPFEKIAEMANHTPEPLWFRAVIQFTKTIAKQMERQGVSRAQLARRLKVSPALVTQVLKGDSNLKLETIAKFANALNCEFGIIIRPRKAFVGNQYSQTESQIEGVEVNVITQMDGATGAPSPFSFFSYFFPKALFA